MIAASLVFYYALLLHLVVSSNFTYASMLWKYTVLMSSPSWLIFLYICLRWRTRSLAHQRRYKEFSVMLVLVAFLFVAAIVAPLFIFHEFAQTYDIWYFDQRIRFSFPSAMIVLLTATSGMVSFNIGLVFRRGDFVAKTYRSLSQWSPVIRNLSIFVGPVLLIQRQLSSADQFMAFSTLLGAIMIVPILHPLFQKLPRRYDWLLYFLGLTSLSIPGILDFLTYFSPFGHPFIVFALCSSVAVCFSSALGEFGSYYLDLRSLTRTRSRSYVAAILLVVLGVVVTWFYSHAAISVTVYQEFFFNWRIT